MKNSKKVSEQLLRENEQLKARIAELEKSGLKGQTWIENSPVWTKIVDLDFNLQYMSNSAIRGLRIDDITAYYGKPYPLDFYPDSFKIPMTNNLKRAKETGETITQEAPIRDIDGNTLWFYSTIVPVYNDKEQLDYLMVVSLETTRRKQAEEELLKAKEQIEESEGKYRLLFERDTDAIFLFNPETKKIIEANQATSKLYGYSPEELLGKSVLDLSVEKEQSLAQLKKVENDGQVQVSLRRHKKKDGSIIYVDIRGVKIYLHGKEVMFAISKDVTDKVLAEASLKKQNQEYEILNTDLTKANEELYLSKNRAEENQKLYEDLVQSSHNLIWKCDLEGKYTFLNSAWENAYGYKVEEMLGRPFSDFQQPEIYERDVIEFTKHLEGGFVKGYETSHIRKDGTEIQLIFNALPLSNSLGEVIGTQGTAFDISKLKQTELALIKAKEKAEKSTYLLEASQSIAKLGGWELDISTNELFWTAETYRIHETSPEEFNPTVDAGVGYFLPDSRRRISNALKAAIEDGEGYDLELVTLTTKGRRIDVRTTCEVTMLEGKPIKLTGIFQDITERKRYEDQLRAAEAKLKNTFDLSPSIICKANLKSGFFIEANPAVTRILGYSIEEYTSIPFIELIHVDDQHKSSNEKVEQMKGKEVASFENRYLCKDGSYKWIAWHGTKPDENGIVTAIGSDITERKLAEESLNNSEMRFRALFEQTGSYCMILDPNTSDGIPIIIDANDAACKIHGYTLEEFKGKPIALVDDDEGKRVLKQRTAEIMTGEPFYVENTHVRKDGTTFIVAVNAKRIDIGNEPPIIFTIEYDITSRKKSEKEIVEKSIELEKHFEKSEKQRVANLVILNDLNHTTKRLTLEMKEREKAEKQVKKDLLEKRTLLQELYHRTKNNMQVISSMMRMEARRSDNEHLKASFKELTSKINTMALVHQKLYQAKDLSRINLSEYIRDLVHLIIRGYSREASKIKFQYEMEDIYVLIDTVMPLGLVINELLSNALKYAFPDNIEGEIVIKLKLDSQGVINLSLVDNGVGIPEDMDLRESKSMGLQTMYSLIEHQLQGRVGYESENGLSWHIKLKDTINSERV